ncbi:hypothetical protein [Streptomyces sp. NPDC046759]|uniref:hypothetical protein n=1 Tax=Streptomyces sp. NPDC046759 TaxID=3155019 RepID=UPI0033CAD55A
MRLLRFVQFQARIDRPVLSAAKGVGAVLVTHGHLALRSPSTLRAPLHLARSGAPNTAVVPVPRSFQDGGILDVPGRPRAVHTPGRAPVIRKGRRRFRPACAGPAAGVSCD